MALAVLALDLLVLQLFPKDFLALAMRWRPVLLDSGGQRAILLAFAESPGPYPVATCLGLTLVSHH